MTEDLAAWLLDRIAEDERTVTAVRTNATWAIRCVYEDGQHDPFDPTRECDCAAIEAGDEMTIYDEGGHDHAVARHIVEWQPARVQAECAAKRRIVGLHRMDGELLGPGYGDGFRWCAECGGGGPNEFPTDWPCNTLKLLALPYAGRSGYREEWRP